MFKLMILVCLLVIIFIFKVHCQKHENLSEALGFVMRHHCTHVICKNEVNLQLHVIFKNTARFIHLTNH